jgi:hypothetical protein
LKANGHENPGPGTYAQNRKDNLLTISFIDKKTAPKFGFGTSKREKNYLESKY